MASQRIFELAKELGCPSKDLMEILHAMGVEVKTHMAVLDEATVVKVRTRVAGGAAKAPKKAAAKKSSTAPEKEAAHPKKEAAAPKKEPAHPKKEAAAPKKEAAPAPKVAPPAAPVVSPAAVAPPVPTPVITEPVPSAPVPAPSPAVPAAAIEPQKPQEEKFVRVSEGVTVKELAEALGVKAADLMKDLIRLGIMVAINQSLDTETVRKVAGARGYTVAVVGEEESQDIEEILDQEQLVLRPPVVTIMGHVDHGKTSLLDAIRSSRIVDQEKGEITQHIGAYRVDHPKGTIVFLDTPGHQAFTAMRARGAKVTDLVVLVVAADDGVKPQTIEAIDHAKAAEVPIIVAVNKIDKPGADPAKVRQQLLKYGLLPEDLGGETIYCDVSAKKMMGIDHLLEMILLQAEIMELKANPAKQAVGVVVESKLDKGRGPVATVLIQGGTLRAGDAFVCGLMYGRVRALFDERGKTLDLAGPSIPVEVLGFSGVPAAGDRFVVVEDDKRARQISGFREDSDRQKRLASPKRATLEDLFAKIKLGEISELTLIVKGDVTGSVEVLTDQLPKLAREEVKVRVLHGAVGAINENDVTLAIASNAIIVGFNVRPEPKAAQLAEREGVDIRVYGIIYDAIDDVKKAITGMLKPTFKEKLLGTAEIRQVFKVSRIGSVAGCYVTSGVIQRTSKARLVRDGIVVFDGALASLRRFKDDAKEVAQGYECGIGLANFNDIKLGDVIESYTMEVVEPGQG
jgi:translation initiation factor IF-2